MFVKKFKRKCSVRGCKNITNVYLVSKRREMGGTIGICTDCLKEATQSIADYTEPPKVVREDEPLFPHPKKVTISSVAEEPEPIEVIEDAVTEDVSVAEDVATYNEKTTPAKPKTTAKGKNKGKKK